ncbi:MAG: radical SAM protein [Phycisphaerae bacterium]|nr:radical SAM protein [Phycisphaerae bacterium]
MSATNANPLQPAVVLVADRTLSARYNVLFEGIFATMQTTQVPSVAMKHFVSPRQPCDATGRALAAPLGVRRVEASLRAAGLSADDVVVTTPECLPKLLGPWTKLVMVSSSDFLGHGMSNTTTHSFWSGRLYTEFWMSKLMATLRQAKMTWGFSILAGGAGAWQLVQAPATAEALGFDIVFDGYFEGRGAAVVQNIVTGRPDAYAAAVVAEATCCVEKIKPILAPSTLGVIELSRGCGKGCGFCVMGTKRMDHLPPELILADVETNARGGQPNIVSSSEDFFRYGGTGPHVNYDALASLLERMRQIKGLRFMQADHGNVSSVLQFDVAQLRELRRLLEWDHPSKYQWVNLGVESANGELVRANCPGKLTPINGDWEDMVRGAVARLVESGWFPVISLVLGLPGETPDDVARTRKLVDWLDGQGVVVFPVFHEPIRPGDDEKRFTVNSLTLAHLELYSACYEINFRRVPKLYADNQRAGGVSWLKRTAIQVLGKTEVRAWRKNFRRQRRRIESGR